MKTPLSCCDLDFLIWCYWSPEIHPRLSTPAIQEAAIMFLRCGMVERTDKDNVFRVTDKGRAMIEAMTNLKEPVCSWSVPQ